MIAIAAPDSTVGVKSTARAVTPAQWLVQQQCQSQTQHHRDCDRYDSKDCCVDQNDPKNIARQDGLVVAQTDESLDWAEEVPADHAQIGVVDHGPEGKCRQEQHVWSDQQEEQ